jgi:hypothetical protein
MRRYRNVILKREITFDLKEKDMKDIEHFETYGIRKKI